MSPHDWSYLKGLQRFFGTGAEKFEDETEFDDTSRHLPAAVLPLAPAPPLLPLSQVSPSLSTSLSSALLNNNSNDNDSRPDQPLSCSISRSINSQFPDGSPEVQEEEATCTTIGEANSKQMALFICPDPTCAKQFRDEVGLRYELNVMLLSIPARLTRSRRHSKIHSDPRLRCGVPGCHFAVRWPKDLRRHMSTHEKSFPCEVPGCDKSFQRQDNYLRHLRARHVDSDKAAAILGANTMPDRLPRLSQPITLSARNPTNNAGEGGAFSTDPVPNHTTSDEKSFTNERLDDNLVRVSSIWSKSDIPWLQRSDFDDLLFAFPHFEAERLHSPQPFPPGGPFVDVSLLKNPSARTVSSDATLQTALLPGTEFQTSQPGEADSQESLPRVVLGGRATKRTNIKGLFDGMTTADSGYHSGARTNCMDLEDGGDLDDDAASIATNGWPSVLPRQDRYLLEAEFAREMFNRSSMPTREHFAEHGQTVMDLLYSFSVMIGGRASSVAERGAASFVRRGRK